MKTKGMYLAGALALAVILGGGLPALATYVYVDTYPDWSGSSFTSAGFGGDGYEYRWQYFRAPASALSLDTFRLWYGPGTAAGGGMSFNFWLKEYDGVSAWATVDSGSGQLPNLESGIGDYTITLNEGVTGGDYYVLLLQGTDTPSSGNFRFGTVNGASDANALLDAYGSSSPTFPGSPPGNGSRDWAFTATFTEVPEPSSLGLLALGVLSGLIRRR